MLSQFVYVTVRFSPRRTDDLQPEASWWVGREFRAMPSWIVEDGQYAGQWALVPDMEAAKEAGDNVVGWFPECDCELADDGDDECPGWPADAREPAPDFVPGAYARNR
jgi:hypothetical protein